MDNHSESDKGVLKINQGKGEFKNYGLRRVKRVIDLGRIGNFCELTQNVNMATPLLLTRLLKINIQSKNTRQEILYNLCN